MSGIARVVSAVSVGVSRWASRRYRNKKNYDVTLTYLRNGIVRCLPMKKRRSKLKDVSAKKNPRNSS